MTELEKAQKKFWYDKGFHKWDSGYVANAELNTFGEGWKAALKWFKSRIDYANATNDMVDWIFEEELGGIG
ncbi:MAG: hypothetical protein QQN41_05910 [Nitrosopumilus sp.]